MVRLHFEKLSRYERLGEPCSCAIPFPQGVLYDISKTAVSDGQDRVPVQCRSTAKWPDNSVKWLLITFPADLPANGSKDYYFLYNNGKASAKKSANVTDYKVLNVTLEEASGRIRIDTGEISLYLSKPGEDGLFYRIVTRDTSYGKGIIEGPFLINDRDEEYSVHIGSEGWEVLDSGPVAAVVQAKGKHYSSSEGSYIDYVVRVHAYSGKPWIRIDYSIVNREEGEAERLHGIELRIRPGDDGKSNIKTALAFSNYTSIITEGSGDQQLFHCISADQLMYEANEHIPETFYGTFWADWTEDRKGGICTTLYQAHQNFPKALEVGPEGITMGILPKGSMDLNLIQGMGKTHRLFLHFHGPKVDLESLNVRSLQMQLPDRPVLDTEVYERSGIFNNIFVEMKDQEVERALIAKADTRGKAYGILHWGDAPDPGYTEQGRGNGEPVWTNNEYDFPHAAMLMYARTSERRMLDYLLTAAEHWKDVDICHYSRNPLRDQAQIIHSANHVTGEVEISHEWVEGLLDYYHMTGDISAYEAALGIGKNILYHLGQPRYHRKGEINARETGWALRSLVALYQETYNEKWLQYADMIVCHFESWKEEYGGWLSPYTDHTVIRVPFMISIATGSLMRYYRIRPQERIRAMIIDAVNDMVENCILDNGLFYYKELPSLRRLGNNTLVLEALADAYELTGDLRYLKYGLPTFSEAMKPGSKVPRFTKQIRGDAVLLPGPGPKDFAQSFYPIVAFYAAASKAGLLGIRRN